MGWQVARSNLQVELIKALEELGLIRSNVYCAELATLRVRYWCEVKLVNMIKKFPLSPTARM